MKRTKTLFKTLGVAVVAALMLVSCGKSGKDIRTMLPKDAFMTISFNPKSLAEKANVGDFTQSVFYRLIDRSLGDSELATDQRAYVLSLVASPSKTGLSTQHDGYMFITAEDIDRGDMAMGMLYKVEDRKALEKFVGLMMEQGTLERIEENGYTVVGDLDSRWNTTLMAFNDDAFMFYYSSDDWDQTRPVIASMFAHKKEESLLAVDQAAKALNAKYDICMIMGFEQIMSAMPSELRNIPTMSFLSKAYFTMPFNFEKGKVTSDMTVFFTDKQAEEEYEKLKKMNGSVKGDLAKYIPASSMFAVYANINGAQVYEYLSSIPMYSMVMAMAPQVKQVMDAIEGDIVVGINTVTFGGGYSMNVPEMTVMMQLKSTEEIQALASMLAMLPVQQTAPYQYSYTMGEVTAHFGLKDNLFYATTDRQTLAAMSGEKIESIADRYGRLVTSGYGAFLFDFAALRQLLEVGIASGDIYGQVSMILPILEQFETVQMHNPDLDHAKMEVTMTDKSRNALESVYKAIENLVDQMDRDGDL